MFKHPGSNGAAKRLDWGLDGTTPGCLTCLSSPVQLNRRLKTAKRQMDEAEEEIERLEHAKKKLQRDLDEQAESSEELQSQLYALRNEIR